MLTFFVNLWKKIIGDTPEARMKRYIKDNVRKLSSGSRKYLTGNDELLHKNFITDLHQIFSVLNPFLKVLKEEYFTKKGNVFKRFLVEHITEDEQKSLIDKLSEENIIESIRNMTQEDFYRFVEETIQEYINSFTPEKKMYINNVYNMLHTFAYLAEIDYGSFFREFDRNFDETRSDYKPFFQNREARIFTEDFKLIHRVGSSLAFDDSLKEGLEVFSNFRSIGFDEKKVRDALKKFSTINQSGDLDLLIKTLQRDPEYTAVPFDFQDKIVRQILDKIVADIRSSIDNYFEKMKRGHIEKLLEDLFQNETVGALKGYNSQQAQKLSDAGVTEFTYTDHLLYIKMWLILKYRRHISQNLNTVMLQASWNDDEVRQVFNDTYHLYNEYLDRIRVFDEYISESGEGGKELNRMLMTKSQQKSSYLLDEFITKQNEKAEMLIRDFLISFKMLLNAFIKLNESVQNGNKKVLRNVLEMVNDSRNGSFFKKMPEIIKEMTLLLTIFKTDTMSA